MKKILALFVLAVAFILTPHDAMAQKKKSKPKAKTDPTLRPSKKQSKVQKKMKKRRTKSAMTIAPKDFAAYWRREDGSGSTI
jgi:hypothetical protein